MADDDKNFSDHFLEVDEDPFNERKAFFDTQDADRRKFLQRITKPPVGSNSWPNVSGEKISDRKAFFDKQKSDLENFRQRRAIQKNPLMPMLPSKLWTGLSIEQIGERKKFLDKQKDDAAKLRARKKAEPSTKWFNVNNDKRNARSAFFDVQAAKRSTLGRSLQKGKDEAALALGLTKTTSSQWTTQTGYSYHVTVPGIFIFEGSFRRISGLATDERVIETYHEGGDNGAEHYLVGHQKNGKIVMEWALRHPDPFLVWWIATGTGVVIHEPINITLLDVHKAPVAMWSIMFAMATKIEFAELDAMNSEVATNKIELIHNGLIAAPM